MTQFIYVLSLHHTGTWFVVKFLTNHPGVDGFIQTENLIRREFKKEHGIGVQQIFRPGKINVLQSHVVAGGNHLGAQLGAAILMPTVIPIRDPLLCIISGQGRDKFTNSERLALWVEFVRGLGRLRDIADPAFIPVDLLKDYDSRYCCLIRALDRAQLSDRIHAKSWAQMWPVVNSASPTEMKNSYYEGDAHRIELEMPGTWYSLKCAESFQRDTLPARAPA